MQANLITTVLLPLALAIIMFGLGLHLRVGDFTRVLRMPRPVLIGLAAQMLLLPPLAYALCLLFTLPPALAVGLMLLAASPGGATANVFSHLARGDVALNITLTAINSVLALVALPLIVQWSIGHFLGAEALVPPPVRKIVEVGVIVLVPVALGMLLLARAPTLAVRLERVVKPLSLLILLALIVLTAVREFDLLRTHAASLGLVCLLLNALSLLVGYGVARLARVEARQAIAIAFEVGIHNGTLAIFIALSVLKESAFSVPAALYSLLMYFTAAAMLWWFRRKHREAAAA
jgi:bile acid:Na+ symporter, BASS family